MADLLEKQWELGGVVFGLDCRVQSDPEVGVPWNDVRSQDSINPVGDDTRMGRDRRSPGSWSFKLFVDQEDEADALDALDELATAWDADEIRANPDAVMALRYHLAGRTRRVYGRPRRWTAPLTNDLLNGYIVITADFQLRTGLYFDDMESSVEIDSRPTVSDGGFDVPFDAPIEFQGQSPPREKPVIVTGRKATPVVVDFHGPSVNPVLELPDWRLQLNATIPAEETFTVDSRPWSLGVTRKDGSPVSASVLGRSTRLRELVLRANPDGTPREHSAIYTTADTSGQSKVTVRWRNAHLSP